MTLVTKQFTNYYPAMYDLHTHSTASDGSLSPTALVQAAAEAGVSTLSLTDHDTVAGLEEAHIASKQYGIELVNGIELSVSWGSHTLHIVGLNIDPQCQELSAAITLAQRTRTDRGIAIGNKLEAAGIENIYQQTCDMAQSDLVGRAHFARALVAGGHAKNFKQVFKRFMVRGKPGYESAQWMTLQQAIDVIHQAGGKAVIAHPTRYSLSRNKLLAVVEDFKQGGGDAIEVSSGKSNETETGKLAALANEHQLSASTGSDFHGPDKPWIALGRQPPLPDHCTPVWQTF